MVKRLVQISLVLSFSIIGCRKDPVTSLSNQENQDTSTISTVPCEIQTVHISTYDTIYTNPYLALWPGSWWEYDDGSIDSCFGYEPLNLKLFVPDGSYGFINENNVFVPYLNNVPYFEDSYIKSTYADTIPVHYLCKKIDSMPGSNWQEDKYSYDWGSDYATKTITTTVDSLVDSMAVLGTYYYDVVCISSIAQTVYSSLGGGPADFFYFYYAKNIGLIKSIKIYDQFPGLNGEWNLVNYYIAPH